MVMVMHAAFDMPMIVAFGADRWRHREPMFSRNEIFCGPRCETVIEGGRVRSVKTPGGPFDLGELVRQLPPDQKPEAVVIQVDRTGATLARNLQAVSAKKVLFLTDTHHMQEPLSFILNYALNERYDLVVGEACRHHLHFFAEAGLPTYWLPLGSFKPHVQPLLRQFQHPISFVGSVGRFHLFRRYVLHYLHQNGISFPCFSLTPEQTAVVNARTLINLNVSLNGDMNLRLLEIMAAGGFVLTDRQTPQVGLNLLFEDRKDLVFYRRYEELLELIPALLKQPEAVLAIRDHGHATCLRDHAPEVKVRQFLNILTKGEEEAKLALHLEPRCRRAVVPVHALFARLRIYEYLQEEHRKALQTCLVASPQADSRTVADLADLWRLGLRVMCRDEADYRRRQFCFSQDGVLGDDACLDGTPGRIGFVGALESAFPASGKRILLLAAEDHALLELSQLEQPAIRPHHILIEGGRDRLPLATLSRLTETLLQRGYSQTDPQIPAFRHASAEAEDIPAG